MGVRAKDKSFHATMKTDLITALGKINVKPHEQVLKITNQLVQ